MTLSPSPELTAFLSARDFLLQHRTDYELVYQRFRWPQLRQFNWALDYFDGYARGNQKPALWIVDENGSEQKLSYDQMSRRSNQVANFLRKQGVRRGRSHHRHATQRGRHVGSYARFDEAGLGGDPRGDPAYSRRY